MQQLAAGAAPILVVEDEPSLMEAVKYALEREGYIVESAFNGREGLEKFDKASPRLVLLDLMLPEISGLDLCRIMRSDSIVPILIVTAKDAEADKVVGLEIGADDYITKPFSMAELLSRVRALLRRAGMTHRQMSPVLTAGPLEMDTAAHKVRVRGRDLTLPPKEFALLKLLLEEAGRLLTREVLIRKVWGTDYYGDTRTLDVHVKRLRAKIELDPRQPRILRTVRGLGYKFDEG
jgi:two-component system response regulator RegX3